LILSSIFSALFSFIVAISLIASLKEYLPDLTFLSNKWLASFSAIDNAKSVLSVERSSGEIPCLDGIRWLNTLMLLFAHKGMELNFTPMTNRVWMNDEQKELVSVPQRALYLNTDAFLMLSGLLISYSFIGRLQRGRKIEIIKEIAGRYFRLVPPMAALMIFGTFIFPLLGSGPQWNMLVTYQSDLCKKTWWRNFLMIHNWLGFENICMTHMHHIGSDFELFIASIFVIIFLHKSPKYGTIAILVLSCASTLANFLVSFTTQISAYILYGME
jgi:hypothetical protein